MVTQKLNINKKSACESQQKCTGCVTGPLSEREGLSLPSPGTKAPDRGRALWSTKPKGLADPCSHGQPKPN